MPKEILESQRKNLVIFDDWVCHNFLVHIRSIINILESIEFKLMIDTNITLTCVHLIDNKLHRWRSK